MSGGLNNFPKMELSLELSYSDSNPNNSHFLHFPTHSSPHPHPSLPPSSPFGASQISCSDLCVIPLAHLSHFSPCSWVPALPGRNRRAILWGLTWVIWELSPEPLSLRGLASKIWTSLTGNSMDSTAQLSASRFSFRLQRGELRGRFCKTGAQEKAL